MIKEKDNWTQNIEKIFTKEELNDFVHKKRLEKIKIKGKVHYIKQGCSKWFRNFKRWKDE